MSELPLNQVLCGDCAEVMRGFPSNSVDLVVTDPPYGLNFMGKDWDKVLPPREAFEEVVRVLKPGALAFVMSSPRQDLLWRMLSMLEGVGFELNQSYIEWIYKTGFPKAYDVSKGIDRKQGVERKIIGEGKGTSLNYQNKINLEQGFRPNDYYDEHDGTFTITEPASDLAKKWSGWKSQTGLKPAHEPILMVNKPFTESTIVDNVLKWGTGAINVDACRIPFKDESLFFKHTEKTSRSGGILGKTSNSRDGQTWENTKGRFPANLLVSDKAIDTGKLSKSGTLEPHHRISAQKTTDIYGKYNYLPAEAQTTYGDVGDQSRYFDLDAWAKHHGFLDVPKPSKAERDKGLSNFPDQIPKSKFNLNDGSKDMRFDGIIPQKRKNVHPTVKPIKLMAYLIELGCPPKGIVLDPFCGSGTTCIATKQLRRKYIGIEINQEYADIARARITPKGPLDLFIVPPKPRI